MTRSDYGQDPLFYALPDNPPPRPPRAGTTTAKPRWSRYTAKAPAKCDDCMLLLATQRGHAPASRQAKWRRKAGGTDLLLCYAHAQAWRAEDGLGQLKV